MPVIKRYSNRKLYDVEAKQYVTLDNLAEFIRKGEDIRVVDHGTGEDLTSITLLQVVFEEQKKIGVLLPRVFLTRLIRSGGEAVSSLRGRLSILDPVKMVDDEIQHRLDALVESGKVDEDEALRLRDLLFCKPAQADILRVTGDEDEKEAESANRGRLSPDDVVKPGEVASLLRQVEMLEAELASLKAGRL